MEPHAKLQVISILKKSHKNFTSTNPGLKVDQIYPYIAASPDLLVSCHCCGNGVCWNKMSLFCLWISPFRRKLILFNYSYRRNHAQIQGKMAIINCTLSWFFVYTFNNYHVEKNLFDETCWSSILKNLTWFWYEQLASYLLCKKDENNDAISFIKNSDMNLNGKKQSTSQTVTSTVIEVRFPQDKKTKRKSTLIKEK